MDELICKLKEVDVDEVRNEVECKITEIKNELADLDKEKVLKIAKRKANQIQDMASELVSYVKEKGTPVLEELALSVKEKAINVTKEVLNKLENED